ncbi:MAG: DUF488 family protein [Candidatus Limnocylindria bacterium]
MRIWSIGHGARTLEELLRVLGEAGIRTVADIRTFPASRRHPHFGRETLTAALTEKGIAYEHIPELGGRRRETKPSPHRAIRVAGLRAYADHMDTDEFRAGYDELLGLGRERPAAFMCAESLWWQCHRRLLSDRLTADGWEVVHLLGPGKAEPHRLWDVARVVYGRLVYDLGTLALPDV